MRESGSILWRRVDVPGHESARVFRHADHWHLEGMVHPIELRYNSEARSFRLNYGQSRLYFLERIGFFQSKLLITTEYNVEAGACYFLKNRFAGILQLEDKKYEFRLNEDHISLSEKNKVAIGQVDIDTLGRLDHFEFGALLFAFANLQHIQKAKHSNQVHLKE